jgi:hypothetical protein
VKKAGAASPEGVTRACLDNPQVLRSSDNSNKIQELHWTVQNANDFSIHALMQAGYDAQWLKAMLKKLEDTNSRPITQLHTQARQEALAHAHSHGGRFHATGGMHVTLDDMFILMEINARNEKRAAIEKEKNLRLSLQANAEKAMAIINQGKPLNLLSVADLDVLLAWHQAPKTKGVHKKKEEKVQQWMTILGDGGKPPAYERWTDEDKQRLGTLATTEDIDMSNTQYGRKMVLKKRELEAAADNFSQEERDALQQKWDAMDAEEAITLLEEELQAEMTESTEGETGAV